MSVFTFMGKTETEMGLVAQAPARQMLPTVTPATQTVPGRVGAWRMGREIATRSISIPVTLTTSTKAAAQDQVRVIAAWLLSGPGPLIFADEPGRVLTAEFTGDAGLTELASWRQMTLTFTCADPYYYGATPDVTELITGANTVANSGLAEAKPVFTLSPLSPATFVKFTRGSDYMLLGREPKPDASETATPAITTQFYSTCGESPAGYGNGTSCDGGSVSGTMGWDGAGVWSPNLSGGGVTGAYGSGTNWHGPVKRLALSQAATDFRVQLTVGLMNTADAYGVKNYDAIALTGTDWKNLSETCIDGSMCRIVRVFTGGTKYTQGVDYKLRVSGGVTQIQRVASGHISAGQTVGVWYKYLLARTGRIEAYLLDTNNAIIGKLAIKDQVNAHPDVEADARAGTLADGHLFSSEKVIRAGVYNDFSGTMWIERKGSLWTAHFAELVNGKEDSRYTCHWTDTAGTWDADLGAIDLHIGVRGTTQPCTATVTTIAAWELNDTSTAVPIIADDGDTLIVDHANNRVTLNGADANDLIQVGSTPFAISPGGDAVSMDSDASIGDDATASVTPRWL